jgi:hypothetical protein
MKKQQEEEDQHLITSLRRRLLAEPRHNASAAAAGGDMMAMSDRSTAGEGQVDVETGGTGTPGGRGGGISETERQLRVVERWGCMDPERLNGLLLQKTVLALFSNQTVYYENLIDVHGQMWDQFDVEEMVHENMTQVQLICLLLARVCIS